MTNRIKFEDIRKMYKEYADKIMRIGTERIIETEIPWNKLRDERLARKKLFRFFIKKHRTVRPNYFVSAKTGKNKR